MSQDRWATDEDRMIYRYQIHRDLVGWVMQQLQAKGIPCDRPQGNYPQGDILLHNNSDLDKAQAVVMELHQQFNPEQLYRLTQLISNTTQSQFFIEIKGAALYGQDIDAILAKGTVIGVVSTQAISHSGHQKLEPASITHAHQASGFAFLPHAFLSHKLLPHNA